MIILRDDQLVAFNFFNSVNYNPNSEATKEISRICWDPQVLCRYQRNLPRYCATSGDKSTPHLHSVP
jgi:hypothetical protein